MGTFRRALNDAQKQERRKAILDTTLHIFENTPYRDITLEMVAEQVGVARATFYLYFKTREELFLSVLEMLLEPWFASVDEQLSFIEGGVNNTPSTILQVTEIFTEVFTHNMAVARLMALLPSILEYNIDIERARAFKKTLLILSKRTGKRLEHILPFLQPGKGLLLLVFMQTLLVGIVQQAEPAPVIQELLNESDMTALHIEFAPIFSQFFRALLFELEREQ